MPLQSNQQPFTLQHVTNALLALVPDGKAGVYKAVDCRYINNPDGTIRWIWPAAQRKPEFLRFYHAGSFRARCYTTLVKWCFRMGLPQWIQSGKCVVAMPEAAAAHVYNTEAWALFTGTVGPNRKMVLWYGSSLQQSVFVKLANGEHAISILRREELALSQMNGMNLKFVQAPAVAYSFCDGFAQYDVSEGSKPAGASMQSWPGQALSEWLTAGIAMKPLGTTTFYHQWKEAIERLSAQTDQRIPDMLVEKLQRLFASIDAAKCIPVAPAHGDCTPWNVLLKQQQVAMIDWELYMTEAPAGFDFFHYAYQSGVMLGNKGFLPIRSSIDQQVQKQPLAQLQHSHAWDMALLEKLYLVGNMAYYLQLYSQQQQWHKQVYWLLQTWNDALSYWLLQEQVIPARQLLLQDISVFMHHRPHAAMKLLQDHVLNLPESSDLDLCTTKALAKELGHYLDRHPAVAKVTRSQRSHMLQLCAILHDGSMLYIDAIWQFKRRYTDFLDSADVLHNAAPSAAGLRVPLAVHDFLYTWLFYVLNNAEVPAHYVERWNQLPASDKHGILNYVEEQTGRKYSELELLVNSEKLDKRHAEAWIRQRRQNRGIYRISNMLHYAMDCLRTVAGRRGMMVTFSGVDGAGKSTIIEATRQRIEKALRRPVVVLRHRPSLLPILSAWKYGKQEAESRAAATLPRQGNNKSSIGSLLRFSYYYADYIFGQFYIYTKYVLRGYVVLYDRYYFDFINDSLRSNIRLPKRMAAAGYSLLLKPRLNFFLYASPEEILARKQELSATAIEHLTAEYQQLFSQLTRRYKQSHYVSVHNHSLDQTLQFIVGRITALA